MPPRVIHGASLALSNKMVIDTAPTSQVTASQSTGTHTGTMSAETCFPYQNQFMNIKAGVPFIADPQLYAYINSYVSGVTWIN